MQDIRTALYQRLSENQDLNALLGAIATDPRIYIAHPPKQVQVSDSQPAYLTVELAKTGPRTGPDGVTCPDESYNVDIWTGDVALADEVVERLATLLDGWSFETSLHHGMTSSLSETSHSHLSDSKLRRKRTIWLVSHILQKT